MDTNPPSSTSLKRNASTMDADDGAASASAKRVRSDEPPPGHPLSASPMARLPLPVTRTVEFALKRSPSSSVPLAAASENDHPPATGPTSTAPDGDPDAAFRAAVLAKLAEASSGSSASPSAASTRTGPLPPIPAAFVADVQEADGQEEADEEEEEETDDPDAERSDGGWDDEDEWVPPPVVRNTSSADIAAEATNGQSLISPPPTPVPARTDAASPMPPPVLPAPGPTPVAEPTADVAGTLATAAAADVAADSLADIPAVSAATDSLADATTAAPSPAAADTPTPALADATEPAAAAVEPAPAPADVDDDWLEAVAPSNFPLPDEDDDAFWPLGPPSPLTQPTHPSPPPSHALSDSQHDTARAGLGSGATRSGSQLDAARSGSQHARSARLGSRSPDSYADSGDELEQQGVEVAPGFALRGSDGAKVQCALCGRWMGPEKTAEHVARVCGTIPSPERARKAAKRRSLSTSRSTPKTRRISTSTTLSTTPKKPRTPRKEKPVPMPAARLAARRAELDADAWAARVDDERGVLCKACGTWVDVGGPGLGAVQRWSGRTGHKSVCEEIVESTRREEAEARMRELTHAHEAPAPVPPEILADKRVRRIDGDQAQCNVCGVWTLFKNWEAHQGGKCEQIRARREAKAARRASKTGTKGLDALSELSSESEDDRRHPVYFVGGPGKKAKAAAEVASGSGTGTVATAASASATGSTSAPSVSAATKAAPAAVVVPATAPAASASASAAGPSVSTPANATAPAAKSSAATASAPKVASSSTSAAKATTAISTAAKNGTASASTSAQKNGTTSASASTSTPATKAGKAPAAPASIYLTPGAPAPTKPPPGWPAGASWRPWMSDPRYGMGVIPVETMQRMYAPGGRYGPPVDKGKGKAAAPAAAASASTSAKPSGPASASTSAKPAASSTGAKPSSSASGPASTSNGSKPPPVTGKRPAGASVDAPAAKKAKVAATPESGPPKKKMLPLESIVAEADARAAAAAAASAAGSSTASGTKSAATTPAKVTKPTGLTPASVTKSAAMTPAGVTKPAATTSAAVSPSTSKTANTAQSATPSASKPRAMQMARKSYRPPPPYGPGKNKRATAFSQAAKRRAASPSSSSESEKEPKPWSNAPQPYLMPANPPRVMQIRRPYQLCGREAFVSSDPNRSTRFEDLPTDPEKLLRYERQVILHFDADVAQITEDNKIQCKGCNAWIKLPTSGVPTKKWYGRIGHKASCPGNIERQKAAAALPAAQIPEVVFDEPFRIQKIKGSKVQCAGCSKNVSAPMWARHVEERCSVYTAATGAPKPESSDSESDAAEAPGPSNGKPRGRLDITIAKRRAQLLEDTAVREIGEDRLMCDLCGKWVKISKHLHAGYKWYGEQGHRARCIASHPDWKPRADKDDPPSSPATSVPGTPAKPGSSTPAAAGRSSVSALRSPNRGTQAPPSSPPSVIVIPDTSSDHEGHDDDAEYNPDNDDSGAESESSEDPELDV